MEESPPRPTVHTPRPPMSDKSVVMKWGVVNEYQFLKPITARPPAAVVGVAGSGMTTANQFMFAYLCPAR